ncbi:MAG: hypothetical protein LPK85_00125 [Gammaproteobacteria bacterium]|nr:hypothetical protein [Gammaproteobacteria bacterium]
MESPKQPVSAHYYPLGKLVLKDITAMHGLFEQYYHNVDFKVFFEDLSKKDGVILLREKFSGKIVGFSTLLRISFDYHGRTHFGIFSGDTIVDQRYWGNRAMLACFVKTLLRFRLKNPLTPLYWLLISKGYKTYLVLTNNFPRHFPHYRKSSSTRMERIIDLYCRKLYPQAYDQQRRLLDFGQGYQKLREDVAAITDDLKATNPKIRFFEERNPTWRDGTELPCVGEVSFSMFYKVVRKLLKEKRNKPPRQDVAQPGMSV